MGTEQHPDPDIVACVPDLLHDATLDRAVVEGSNITLVCSCLRRNVDGTRMEDPSVSLELQGVRAVVVVYESSDISLRPSEFTPPDSVRVCDIADIQARSFYATLNSVSDEWRLESAACRTVLHGDLTDCRGSRYRMGIGFQCGRPAVSILLWIAFDELRICSKGAVLPLARWSEEFSSWWNGWEEHWANQKHDDDREPVEEDFAIPAGPNEPIDQEYAPPEEPCFSVGLSTIDPEILKTLEDWVSAKHRRDWPEVARLERNPDATIEQQASLLSQSHLHDWWYVRSIDGGWVENDVAFVQLRGVEHQGPCEGDPAENREAVWQVRLRFRDQWLVDIYSEGWPTYGSVPKLPVEEKPWLHEWIARHGLVERD